MMPSLAELEQWMEEQLPPNLHDLPHKVHATLQAYSAQIYTQLSDLTPSLSQIEDSLKEIPNLVGNAASSSQQLFQQPPPPPTKVPTLMERIAERADAITGSRRRTNVVAGVALVGISAAVVSQTLWPTAARRRRHALRSAKIVNGTRREIIVVLGGDTPIGQALCHQLSTQGFIVVASVSNEQSMQNFDSLIPPSSRGFIRSIILDPFGPQPQDIAAFVAAVSSSRELRWPLTSAGDPYARPGQEAQVVGLVNSLSYRSAGEVAPGPATDTLASSLQIDRLTDEMQRRVITPLATISALVPLLCALGPSVDAEEAADASPAVIVSLVNHGGETDSYSTALRGGMRRIQLHQSQTTESRRRALSAASLAGSNSRRRRLLVTTLEAKSSSLRTLFASLLPSSVGGGAPALTTSVVGMSSSKRLVSSSAAQRSESDSNKPTRPTYMQRSASMSASKAQKEVEFKRVLEATTAVLLSPLATKALRPVYTIRLPAVASSAAAAADGSSNEHRQLESTLLLRLLHTTSVPFVILARTMGRWLSINPSSWFSSTCHDARGPGYRRSWYNPRPAYGPGPGPASNTHSRTSIRRTEEANKRGETSGAPQDQSRRRNRPMSAASTSSSEAKSSEAAPPSNNGMSSSGIFSSVPSSAFGDGEGVPDLDSEDGNASPFEAESPPLASQDPSTQRHRQQDNESTPSASRVEHVYQSSAPPSSRGTAASGTRSPLGASWVALGESQTSEGGSST